MDLAAATTSDLPALAALVNSAYRGDEAHQGWTTEADYIEGQRTDAVTLAADLKANPDARLLVHRDADGEPVACVWVEPDGDDAWLIGMLSVRPDLQAVGLGRRLLAAAELYAMSAGAVRARLTVINIRDSLIAWYERRGYVLTGKTKPFPYGDERFGRPNRPDLSFVEMEKPL